MKKNIKKLNDNLEISSEVGELFSNKLFLEALISYLKNYSKLLKGIEDSDEEINSINSFLNSILDQNGIKEELDINDIYIFVYDYFNYGTRFHSFLGYINNVFLLDEEKKDKKFNPLFKIMDYLYSKVVESKNFDDKYVLEALINKLRTKVKDVLLDSFNNAMFELSVNGFSTYTESQDSIHKVDFGNAYTFGEELYVYVEYYDKYNVKKIGYMNKKGQLRRSRKGHIINSIEYAFSFGEHHFMKIIDEYNFEEIEFSSTKVLSLEGMNLKNIKIGELNIGNSTLEYLIAIGESILENGNVSNFSNILNKDLKLIKISDLLYFMNMGELPKNNEHLDGINKLINFDDNYILSEINNKRFFDGITFLELTVLNGIEKENLVLTNNGSILADNNGFISNVNGIEEVLSFKFLSYGKKHGYIEGFLDKDMNIVKLKVKNGEKIEEINVFSIKSIMELRGEKYYIINNDNNIVLSEENIIKQLEKYKQFEGITKTFEVKLASSSVEINGEKYNFLRINQYVTGEYSFNFYDLSNKEKIQKVFGVENFIELFDNKEIPKQIINEIEYHN